jgi:hypothetical protein
VGSFGEIHPSLSILRSQRLTPDRANQDSLKKSGMSHFSKTYPARFLTIAAHNKHQRGKHLMKIVYAVLFTTLATLLYAAPFAPADLNKLGWITGDWELQKAKGFVEEHWTAPAAGMMMGTSRTVSSGKVRSFEFLRIEAREQDIFYVAQPQGGPPTDFKATKITESEVIFENPAHDFPKRIIYRKLSDSEMVASVDGGAGTKAQEFTYTRMKADSKPKD